MYRSDSMQLAVESTSYTIMHVLGYTVTSKLLQCESFFLGSWGMNRNAGQTNRVNREAILGGFVCSALRFIPHEPRKKTLIPYIYNVSKILR